MANIHFDDVKIERFALGQEILVNRMAQLIHAMQKLNGEGSSSRANNTIQPPKIFSDSSSRSFRPTFLPRKEFIPMVETRHSAGHNIADNYEYRALPKTIRDGISLAEFIGLKKGGVGIRPPQAMPKENGKDVLALEGKNPSIVIKEEHSKLLGIEREQPMEALTLPRDESLTDFQDNNVKGHGFFEETMEHEPKKEGRYGAPYCGGGLMVEAQSPADNENTQFGGIFKSTIHKRQVDGVCNVPLSQIVRSKTFGLFCLPDGQGVFSRVTLVYYFYYMVLKI
ncbi:hypothetical protein KI387_012370, partial [Taxus chinensis]